jgi:DNA-binding transcriptional ArsR family regulator
MTRAAGHEPSARQASDVVAFGQEVGRVLSDGRVVGRAEPYAKVFPSSRAVKRAVGPTAWVILEDIALDATLDGEGRLVAETNVRRLAANLSLSPNTVTKHLGRLREHGFVLHEEGRGEADGRFEVSRYVLDPSAAVERFTVTPSPTAAAGTGGSEPCRKNCDTDATDPCLKNCDTDPCRKNCDTARNGHERAFEPVSQSTVHGDLRHNKEQDVVVNTQQHFSAGVANDDDADRLRARLAAHGVAASIADELTAGFDAGRLVEVLDAVPGAEAHSPAGWLVAALRGGWDVAELAREQRALAARRQRADADARQRDQRHQAERRRQAAIQGWAAAAAAALDDAALRTVLGALTDPLPGLARRSKPAAVARLAGWAADVAARQPGRPLPDALAAAVVRGDFHTPPPAELPPCSTPHDDDAGEVDRRVAAALAELDRHPAAETEEPVR